MFSGSILWPGPTVVDAWESSPGVTGTFRINFSFNSSEGDAWALLSSGLVFFSVATTQNPNGELVGQFSMTGGIAPVSSPSPSPSPLSPPPKVLASPPPVKASPPLPSPSPSASPNTTIKACTNCQNGGNVGASTITVGGKTVSYPAFTWYSCGGGCTINIGGGSGSPISQISCPAGRGPFSDPACTTALNVQPVQG